MPTLRSDQIMGDDIQDELLEEITFAARSYFNERTLTNSNMYPIIFNPVGVVRETH